MMKKRGPGEGFSKRLGPGEGRSRSSDPLEPDVEGHGISDILTRPIDGLTGQPKTGHDGLLRHPGTGEDIPDFGPERRRH